jgi:hypothetical protein
MTANCVKQRFFQNRPKIGGVISLHRKNKYVLEKPFHFGFSFFKIFLILIKISRQNCDVKVAYPAANFVKNMFSQTLRCHIFVMKRLTDKVRLVLETSILSRFFIFDYFLSLS